MDFFLDLSVAEGADGAGGTDVAEVVSELGPPTDEQDPPAEGIRVAEVPPP